MELEISGKMAVLAGRNFMCNIKNFLTLFYKKYNI